MHTHSDKISHTNAHLRSYILANTANEQSQITAQTFVKIPPPLSKKHDLAGNTLTGNNYFGISVETNTKLEIQKYNYGDVMITVMKSFRKTESIQHR